MKYTLAAVLLLTVTILTHGSVQAQSYIDGYEGSAIDPFWSATEQFGTIAITTEQAHTGVQSAKFSSSFGGQREVHLTHSFGAPLKGVFSIYFYDVAPGLETLYEKFNLANTITGEQASIGTQDFDAFCYTAQLFNSNTNVVQGPDANCGVFPQITTTNVMRMAGWHKLEINVGSSSVSFLIDGVEVFNSPGEYRFDSVDISVSGPFWRPNTVAYFDDFHFQGNESNTFHGYYRPLLNDGTAIFESGRTIPVKFQLTLPDGSFVNNAVAKIQVYQVVNTSGGTVVMAVDTVASGSSNLGTTFRFDPISAQYIYNLSTRGYSSGTYLLRTTLNDGTTHDVSFYIR